MPVPKSYKFSSLKRRLKHHQIFWNQQRGKGSHGVFEGKDRDGNQQAYTMPSSQQKEVMRVYLRGVCTRFGLEPDELFK
jgi:hypothetical protein